MNSLPADAPEGGREPDVEPVSRRPPRRVRPVVLSQDWRDLTFLHWPVDPDRVAALLPPGTAPDTHEGVAYVGLVPFRMDRVAPGRAPALAVPYVGSFAETNVRLYSVDRAGRRGVVFRSLDAARLLPVVLARATVRLPYMWSRMRVERLGTPESPEYRYSAVRRAPGPRGAGGYVHVRVGAPVEDPDSLSDFLTARWGLHVSRGGRTYFLPNDHRPWPLRHAELLGMEDDLLVSAGLDPGAGPPVSVLFSPGVRARFGLPMRCP